MALPGNSPDINTFEKSMGHYERRQKIKKKLWADISSRWYSINKKAPVELYDSMPKRVKAVFKAKEDLPNTNS